MFLMKGRQGLGQRRLRAQPIWHRHREFVPLVRVTQVSKTLQALRCRSNAFRTEPGSRLLYELTKSQVERCQIKSVVALQHRPHVIIFDVAVEQTER